MARFSSLRDAFTRTDRRRLARALSPRLPGRLYRRVAAVLAIADGERLEGVARRRHVTRRAVDRWVTRYLARRDPPDLGDQPRPGRPRQRGNGLPGEWRPERRSPPFQSGSWGEGASR